MLLKLIPVQTAIPFMRWRKIGLILSLVLTIGAVAISFGRGLNFGIDFLGGTLIEVEAVDGKDIGDFRGAVSGLSIGEITLQEFGGPQNLLIRAQRQDGGEQAQNAALLQLQDQIRPMVKEFRRVEFVGPTVGAELQEAAIWATIAAVLAIVIYVWFRFEWQYGLSAITTLIHDVVMTIGFFALTGLEFNLGTVAALLTIAGYSINDTVVIFDRVRENRQRFKKMPFLELADRSINETLSRTILTSVTTELALIALAIFGGEVIRGFALALMFGVLVGTYSSFFIALPALSFLRGGDALKDE